MILVPVKLENYIFYHCLSVVCRIFYPKWFSRFFSLWFWEMTWSLPCSIIIRNDRLIFLRRINRWQNTLILNDWFYFLILFAINRRYLIKCYLNMFNTLRGYALLIQDTQNDFSTKCRADCDLYKVVHVSETHSVQLLLVSKMKLGIIEVRTLTIVAIWWNLCNNVNKPFNKMQKTFPKDESRIQVWYCSQYTMNILNVKRN